MRGQTVTAVITDEASDYVWRTDLASQYASTTTSGTFITASTPRQSGKSAMYEFYKKYMDIQSIFDETKKPITNWRERLE